MYIFNIYCITCYFCDLFLQKLFLNIYFKLYSFKFKEVQFFPFFANFVICEKEPRVYSILWNVAVCVLVFYSMLKATCTIYMYILCMYIHLQLIFKQYCNFTSIWILQCVRTGTITAHALQLVVVVRTKPHVIKMTGPANSTAKPTFSPHFVKVHVCSFRKVIYM